MYYFKESDERMEFEVKEIIMRYEDVIDNLCYFFKKIGIHDNPIKMYETFRYMLLNHYLSNEYFSDEIPKEFIKLEDSGYIPMDITGSIVLANYGVCRHTTDFLYHIYKHLKYVGFPLCTYHPNLHIEVYNDSNTFLTNKEAQTYIDDAIKDMNLFSLKEELHFIRDGKLEIIIHYLPPDMIPNHIMNIVMDKKENIIHILDSRYDCFGEKVDNEQIKMSHKGLTHIDYVTGCRYHSYYGTDYFRGVELLKRYDTNMEKDMLHSIFDRDSCKEYEKAYKEFKRQNQKSYQAVTDKYHQLIKRKI